MRTGTILKGDICFSTSPESVRAVENGYLVSDGERSLGVFDTLPDRYRDLPLTDHTGHLIVPGLTDLHMHAPQYTFRALGMDLELIEWLNTHTFPEEARYRDPEYARAAYGLVAGDFRRGATTRACLFATAHAEATGLLMDLMEESGIVSYVGKVNMDRNATDALREKDARTSLEDTKAWLNAARGRYKNTYPILTPRFIPSCTDELMRALAALSDELGLPVQTHLSENLSECAWVKALVPESRGYLDAYRRLGLLGGNPTIMAHSVWCDAEETEALRASGIFVAHCPASNMNLASGIAPIRRYLDRGVRVGLGSDVAGGQTTNIFRAMSDAVQVSKLYWRLVDQAEKPLGFEEAFYLATMGGGAFFGKVGSFEEGYEFDAVVLDDQSLKAARPLSVRERLERAVYLSEETKVVSKYVRGARLF